MLCLCALPIVGCLANTVLRVNEAETYNWRLQELGIEPSFEGVEEYIWQSIQPNTAREKVIESLTPLGDLHFTAIGADCEGITLTLMNEPGSRIKALYVPPYGPPVYRIGLCYWDDDTVAKITTINRELPEDMQVIIGTLQAQTPSP